MALSREFDSSYTQSLRNAKKHQGGWKLYGASIEQYTSYFEPVLHGRTIVDLLLTKNEPVVVDIMAPSATIVDLFNHLPQPQKRGIALSYEDLRTDEEKARDTQLNVHQLQGDITKSAAWKNLETELNGQKADLIMERAMGGLSCLPVRKEFYAYAVNKLWNMLSDQEGTMLLQLPSIEKLESVDVFVSEWVQTLREHGIEAESYSLASLLGENFLDRWPIMKKLPASNALRLVKRPDSPAVLPAPE